MIIQKLERALNTLNPEASLRLDDYLQRAFSRTPFAMSLYRFNDVPQEDLTVIGDALKSYLEDGSDFELHLSRDEGYVFQCRTALDLVRMCSDELVYQQFEQQPVGDRVNLALDLVGLVVLWKYSLQENQKFDSSYLLVFVARSFETLNSSEFRELLKHLIEINFDIERA